jgi:hypothetical protein
MRPGVGLTLDNVMIQNTRLAAAFVLVHSITPLLILLFSLACRQSICPSLHQSTRHVSALNHPHISPQAQQAQHLTTPFLHKAVGVFTPLYFLLPHYQIYRYLGTPWTFRSLRPSSSSPFLGISPSRSIFRFSKIKMALRAALHAAMSRQKEAEIHCGTKRAR